MLRRLLGAQRLRGIKDGAQALEPCRGQQIVGREAIDLLDGVGEVGVDLDQVEVRNDQQRRVFQRLAVLEQLLVGFAQVGVLAFDYLLDTSP